MTEYILIADKIDAILPQTQCGQCGFPGCRPYATAIANGEADINQCPPGGDTTIVALATLLGRDSKPLNPEHGVTKPKMFAIIDEARCIGCTLCIQACPVDAILGASKQMHTVILSECTGCELCISPCPVDCIDLVPIKENNSTRKRSIAKAEMAAQQQEKQKADVARKRYEFRLQRLEREKLERAARHDQKKMALTMVRVPTDLESMRGYAVSTASAPEQAAIQAAIERAQARHAAIAENGVSAKTSE